VSALFANPYVLGALATLGVPILIHLLKSKKFEVRQLGTIRFLLAAEKETASRRKLKNFLLLLCRLLIVALAVFIFARPLSQDGQEQDIIILLDASGSMEGETASLKRFELACSKAAEILKEASSSSKVKIFLFSDDVREIPSLDQAKLLPGGRADYLKIFNFAASRFNQSESLRKRLYLISDLQKAGLPEEPLTNFPSDVKISIVNLGSQDDSNVALTGIRNLSPFVGNPGGIEVRFKTFGNIDRDKQLVFQLEVKNSKTIQASARAGDGVLRFKWQPQRHGEFEGKISLLEKGSFPLDDQRSFLFNVRKPDAVLIVNGEATRKRLSAPGYFLSKALETSEAEGSQSGYSVKSDLRARRLNDYSVVAICNAGTLLSSEINELKDFVDNGGSIVYFLGSNTSVKSTSQLEKGGVFPAELTIQRPAIPSPIGSWEEEDAIFRAFAKSDKQGLKRLVFRSAFNMTPDKNIKVVCRLENGTPAILSGTVGKGKVVIVTNPCDRSWTDWPTEKAFVPFVRSLINSFLIGKRPPLEHPETTLGIHQQKKAGIYRKPVVEVMVPDSSESDIVSTDEITFRQRLGLGQDSLTGEEELEPEARQSQTWFILLLILLCLLPFENFLADRSTL